MNVIQARIKLMQAAIRCLAADYCGADQYVNADAEAEYADEQLALAARDLTAVINELPPADRPAGWGIGPGSETA